MPPQRRYTEQELRRRLVERSARIEAAIRTGLDIHHRSRAEWLASRVEILPDGRMAIAPEDLEEVLNEIGRVSTGGAITAALNGIFHEAGG